MFHRRHGLPDDWNDILDAHVAVWRLLDDGEREAVAANADWLLRHKHWEAAFGFELDDTITVTIAVHAGLLVLGLDVDELREVSAVVVYPSAMTSRGERSGPIAGTVSDDPLPILGEAHERRGPVLIAWDEAHAAATDPGHGHNVTLHEFAHKLDMVDQVADGAPRLHHRVDPDRWRSTCAEVFTAMRAGVDREPLDPYGATNPAEFFAVATETFFDVPTQLQHGEPALYDVLRDFYGQDPAARLRRAGGSTSG
jgi:Mlc titration factor MtfA (ptsG expression regulator)